MPYVQSVSIGDFIPEPRCSKSIVGLQTRRRKEGVYKRFGWLRPEGLRSELGGAAVVRGWCQSSESELEEVDLVSLSLKKSISPSGEGAHPLL